LSIGQIVDRGEKLDKVGTGERGLFYGRKRGKTGVEDVMMAGPKIA